MVMQYLSLIGGTGETPRRSARISEKAKATPPEKEHPKKRGQKSSGSKKDETGTVTEENESGNEKEDEKLGEADEIKAACAKMEGAAPEEVTKDMKTRDDAEIEPIRLRAEKVPQTEAAKENAPGHKDIPDSVLDVQVTDAPERPSPPSV
nr:methyl-CpG-binding domain-containing protein 11-like [Populus alba]